MVGGVRRHTCVLYSHGLVGACPLRAYARFHSQVSRYLRYARADVVRLNIFNLSTTARHLAARRSSPRHLSPSIGSCDNRSDSPIYQVSGRLPRPKIMSVSSAWCTHQKKMQPGPRHADFFAYRIEYTYMHSSFCYFLNSAKVSKIYCM